MKECEICQALEFKAIIAQERMYGTGDIFKYMECSSCEALFLADIPADLSKYYPSNYYSFGPFNRSNALLALLKKLRYKAFSRGISFNSPVYYDWLSPLSLIPTSKIADIGCGNGQLLAEMAYSGFQQLDGYDPFVEEAFSSENFSIYKKDFLKLIRNMTW